MTSLPVILHDMEIEVLHLPALGQGFTNRQQITANPLAPKAMTHRQVCHVAVGGLQGLPGPGVALRQFYGAGDGGFPL
jgi:hypothetical protein